MGLTHRIFCGPGQENEDTVLLTFCAEPSTSTTTPTPQYHGVPLKAGVARVPRHDTAPFAAYFELCAGELWPSGSEGESIEPRHGYGRSRAESAIMEALGAHWSLGGALSRPGSAEAPKRRPRPDAIVRSCFVWDALETIVSQHRGDWENKPRVVPRELLAGPRRNQPPPTDQPQ